MRERAKIVIEGDGQIVRLPESCRFPDDLDEVVVRREGKRVILEPADEWSEAFIRMIGSVNEEIERPPSEPPRDSFA